MILSRTCVVIAFAAILAPAQPGSSPQDLRTEYLVNPLGIDVEKPRLTWTLPSGPRGRAQSAWQVLVAISPDRLNKNQGDLWDSGKVVSKDFAIYGGRQIASGRRCYWKVRFWDDAGRVSSWSQPAMFSMGLLRDSDWRASWIGQKREANIAEGTPLPFPWLRKTVVVKQKPREATAYVNALGYYELYVNGKKVDDHVLSPAVSDYSKRTYYVAHDITSYLVEGQNCIALWLGRGWYVRGHPGVIHDGPLVRAQFDLGSAGHVVTDTSWKVRSSPITPVGKGKAFGDYGGERYDAQLELENWNSVGLNDSGWEAAQSFEPPKVPATAQMVEPNRIMQTLNPVTIEETSAGGYLVNMGKNFVGWLELQLPAGAANENVRLEYADLKPTGTRFMTQNQRDEYVTRAGAGQGFRSRFNYHGFQYVHITGLRAKPAPEQIKGYHIRTAYQPAAGFESSDDLMNRIYQTTAWTYENLTLGGYVVDCPTRERLGYGGDAGASIETGLFLFGSGALYSKWMGNWRDAMAPNGDLPYTAPAYPEQGGGGPMWSGFVVTLPWHLYLQYGDRRMLETSYPYIRRWLAFLETKTAGGILEPYVSYGITPPQWNFLGDWVTPKGNASGPRDPDATRFINNAHYLYQLQIAAKVADILGKPDDHTRYQSMAASLRRILHARFYRPETGIYVKGEQAYQAMPLLLGITPPDLFESVRKNLEAAIVVKKEGHLDTGMHGTYFLLKQLMEAGQNDLIYTFTSKTDYPSWGNMLNQGATTMWESWHGGSRIHDTLISIGSWFIQGIGGIRIDEQTPGLSHFLIKPAPVGKLEFARVYYDSLRGRIVSNWRRADGKLYLDVTVPQGSTATLYVPTTAPGSVTEGGRAADKSPGVHRVSSEGNQAVFKLGSGQYEFVSNL